MWMLLHGFTGAPQSWDEVVARAELDPPALTPTLFGHGPNWREDQTESFEAELSRLASLAASLDRPRLICGYSLGARLALGLLMQNPELFDGALLLGVHPGLAKDTDRSRRRQLDASRADLLRNEGLSVFIAAWEELPLFQSQRELPNEALRRQRDVRLGHDAEGLARSLERLGLAEMPDYGTTIASLDTPVTLMAGSRDEKFSAIARELAGRHPRIEATSVEGAGHNLLLEAPQRVAMVMRRLERRAEGEDRR